MAGAGVAAWPPPETPDRRGPFPCNVDLVPASDLQVPVFQMYMNPILAALEALGGSATNDEVNKRVVADMKLDAALLALPRSDHRSAWYRIGWARSYLSKAGLLSRVRRGTWALTQKGRLKYPIDELELASQIRETYKGDADDIDDDVAPIPEDWPGRLAAMRADDAFLELHAARDLRRHEVRAEMRSLFADFREGRVTLSELRDTYDRRTRADWNVFGLKGLSGAMFLNTLVKHLPQHSDEITRLLRAAMTLPASEPDARARMRGLHDRIVELVDTGAVAARNVQATRVPFFVSSTWHVEAPDDWPAYYESMRNPLREFYSPSENVVETYFRFAEGVRSIRGSLGISTWELEHLCEWLAAATVKGGDTDADPLPAGPRVWVFNPGRGNDERWEKMRQAGLLGIEAYGLGDIRAFASLDAVRDELRRKRGPDAPEPVNAGMLCWEFAHDMTPGDEVFVRRGLATVIAYGVVGSAYRFEPARKEAPHVRDVRWLWAGEHEASSPIVVKTLTDVTAYESLVKVLRDTMGDVPPAAGPVVVLGPGGDDDDDDDVPVAAYTVDDAARDLFRPREEIERMRDLLVQRKNLILAGPPGVGKTFVAKRLAWLVAGTRDEALVTTVQFHQSFAYEDFIQGYRPTEAGGFERRNGPFLDFCAVAAKSPDRQHVLVIDEINRGNLSKIFGELLMLIEPDKRDPQWKVRLAYGRADERFYVPPNLHIIGTMNTADRSLALVDYALRRRFAFVELEPMLADPGFETWLTSKGAEPALVLRIRTLVDRVNSEIAKDPQLGRGYLIGHSYFSSVVAGQVPDDAWYKRIIDYEIEPLLQEYWFDRPERADALVAVLLGDG